MTRELGVTYDVRGMLVVAIEPEADGVVVLVLADNPHFKKPLRPGVTFVVREDTDFWCAALPFASLPEKGTLSP